MLEAKAYRQSARGETPLDVDAELERLLAEQRAGRPASATQPCARRCASSSSPATSAARARARSRSTSRPRSSVSCASSRTSGSEPGYSSAP